MSLKLQFTPRNEIHDEVNVLVVMEIKHRFYQEGKIDRSQNIFLLQKKTYGVGYPRQELFMSLFTVEGRPLIRHLVKM
jgi:hypothetical protein